MHYSILTDTRDFVIDPETGVIAVSRRLDRETIREYTLVIQASDSSVEGPPLTAVAVVKIDITDVNDFSPLFHPPSYNVKVSSDSDTFDEDNDMRVGAQAHPGR